MVISMHFTFEAIRQVEREAVRPFLTDRQSQVLDLVHRGFNPREMAKELKISEASVRNHVSAVKMRIDMNWKKLAA